MTQGAAQTDLDSTISTLQGGITSLSPNQAVNTIGSWQQQLSGSGDEQLQGIGSDLGELKRLLTSGTLDGKAIGQVLTRIGENTQRAATKADASAANKLEQLGKLLERAGGALG